MNRIESKLNNEEQDVFYALLSVQESVLKSRENDRISKDIYRWVHTRKVSDYMGKELSWVRYRLHKIKSTGLIELRKLSNNCGWSCASVPGYQEGRYKDYLVKDN